MMVHPHRTIHFIEIIMKNVQKNADRKIRDIPKAHKW